jgi:hypothetical protein
MTAKRAPTTEQLRRAIDSGATGDKVDYPDPAAAPLGADEEAGGRPPTQEEISLSVRQELAATPREPSRQGGRRASLLLAAVIAVIFLVLAAAAWGVLGR